jgi:hypothetical protein
VVLSENTKQLSLELAKRCPILTTASLELMLYTKNLTPIMFVNTYYR